MVRPRRLAALATLVVVALAAPAFAHPGHGNGKNPKHPNPHPKPTPPPCHGTAGVQRLDLAVSGERTWGLYALPPRPPVGVVVVGHGYGHTAESWRKHLVTIAQRNTVIAVAMNYRRQHDFPAKSGDSLPSSRGWRVAEGAEDSIAAFRWFEARCKGLERNTMFGVSMGFNTAGLAVAAKPMRAGGKKPMFDWLVDAEGAANVTETYLEARALASTGNSYAKNAVADIEEEMGGPIETHRDVYLSRTVVNRVDDIKASGIKGVVVVHGVADGLVPYNQSRELAARLRSVGVNTDFFTVATRGANSEPGTTIDGYVTGNVPGYTSPFSGHASESSDTHLVMRWALERLAQIYAGKPPACREWVVDGTAGDAPHPLTTGATC